MSYTVKCISHSDTNYVQLLSGYCPVGFKRALVADDGFLEFDEAAFDHGFYGVLSMFVIGLGVGFIIALLRKLRA